MCLAKPNSSKLFLILSRLKFISPRVPRLSVNFEVFSSPLLFRVRLWDPRFFSYFLERRQWESTKCPQPRIPPFPLPTFPQETIPTPPGMLQRHLFFSAENKAGTQCPSSLSEFDFWRARSLCRDCSVFCLPGYLAHFFSANFLHASSSLPRERLSSKES